MNYFLHHPAAADTFEGVVRWRILDEIAKRNIASTEHAMQWLIAQGFLKEEKIAGGQSMYRLDDGKREEAQLLVKEKESKQSHRSQRKS